MISICGATGNVGGKLAEMLLKKGEKIRTIGRSAERLHPLVEKGAEVAVGSLDDPAFVAAAFRGAEAVFAMIPPDWSAEKPREYQGRVGAAIAQAVKDAGVKYVVNLSSVGAHLPEGTGPVEGLYDQEQRLNAITDLNVLHLRAGYFMENTLGFVGSIKSQGVTGASVNPDAPIPAIATQDIAAVAAESLTKRNFSGKQVEYLLGERDISMNEIAQVIGKKIGNENLRYVQFPPADFKKGLMGVGMSGAVADSMLELNEALDKGLLQEDYTRSAANSTPTSFEAFAEVFASLINT